MILKDLERLIAKYKRKVDQEQAKRQKEFETVMEYRSEREIQDAYHTRRKTPGFSPGDIRRKTAI